MKEDFKKNNTVHLQGYVNDVRMNEYERGDKKMTAINLIVATQERYQDKDGVWKARYTNHEVAMFTDKKDVIEKFGKVSKDIEEKNANKETEGFKATNHTVSLDGILVNGEKKLGEDSYRSVQIIAKADGVKLDAKKQEEEVSNKATLSGNVANVYVDKEKNFAVLSVIHNFRPEGTDKDMKTAIDVRVSGDRKFSAPTYEKIAKGEIGTGDFIRVSGQLHNANRPVEGKGTRYGVARDLTGFEMIQSKAEKREAKAEVKAAPKAEKKAEKAPAQKAEPKKATSRKKKAGVTMN